jgi:predicted phage gp36 major capsid-like protein
MDIEINDRAPESKAGIAAESSAAFDERMRVFEAFCQANDERLSALERRSADPLLDQKVDRINAELTRRLDELTLKNARPAFAREPVQPAGAREHKMAFDTYLRRGESANLRALEVKSAMSVGSNPDGGYPDWEIMMRVDVIGKENEWPAMGVIIHDDEIIDDLKREFLPEEFRSLRYEGSKAVPG